MIITPQIAGKINRIIRDIGLRDLGQLEQDLVFGDAGAKDVINFLRMKQVMLHEAVVIHYFLSLLLGNILVFHFFLLTGCDP